MTARALWDICQSLYFPLNLKIRSPKTRYQYWIAVECFGRHLGRMPTDSDLTDDAVTLWMGSLLQREPPLSVDTVRERVNRVLALWAWLAKRTVGMRWPTVIKPPAPDPLPIALTQDQLRRFFASARKERGSICGIPADVWCVSYFGFVFSTSERKGASLAARIDWFDFERLSVRIPPASRKGGRKWGVYSLWPELIPLLQACIAADPNRELMWPWEKCEVSYYTMYNRILRDAQIPVDRKHKTHSLRVSHATWKAALGGDPQRALGHDTRDTTDRHYIDRTLMPADDVRLFVPWDRAPPAGAE